VNLRKQIQVFFRIVYWSFRIIDLTLFVVFVFCAQFDVFGDAHGLLASHPVTPFMSMHHLELLDPVFPQMSHLEGLRLLTKAMRTEPGSFLQQSIAYDKKRSLSFSISTGYVIQVRLACKKWR